MDHQHELRETINEKRPTAIRRAGATPRALLLGTLLIPVMCLWSQYSEIVAQSTELAVLSLSIGVLFALLLLLAVNAGLRRYVPRLALTRPELLFVYVMQTTSIGISTVGMVQFLDVGLANVFHYASDENGWAGTFQPLLRSWAFPHPEALRAFYLGGSSLFTRSHLAAWIAPILVWSAFIVVLLGVMLCLNVLLRRRWIEQERLTFPLVMLPLELTSEGRDRAFLSDRRVWAGFLIAFTLENLAGFAYLYPSLPFLPIKPSDPRLNLGPYFSEAPWNAVGELTLSFYPTVIGLTYFLPLDVSFSCWFFFLLRKSEDVLVTSLGFRDPGASAALARMPYYGEQAFGAFLGFALLSLWGARGYLLKALRSALRRHAPGEPSDDAGEPISYRGALAGVLVGGAMLVGFAMALGMSAGLAVTYFVLWFLVVLTYTRIRAEAGLPWAFGPDMTPHQAITAASGTSTLGTQNMVALTQFQWMDLDYRPTAMPHQLEAMKIAGEAGMSSRHLFQALLLAAAVGTLVSWLGVLSIYYHYGAATARVDTWRTSMGSMPWNLLSDWVNSPTKRDIPRLEGVAAGALVTGLLAAGRTRFTGWPLHPVGYVLAGTFTMPWLWCATFLGWLLKLVILRYGGMRGYRFFFPFFIGLILGDYVSGGLWALYGTATGIQTYRVLPI